MPTTLQGWAWWILTGVCLALILNIIANRIDRYTDKRISRWNEERRRKAREKDAAKKEEFDARVQEMLDNDTYVVRAVATINRIQITSTITTFVSYFSFMIVFGLGAYLEVGMPGIADDAQDALGTVIIFLEFLAAISFTLSMFLLFQNMKEGPYYHDLLKEYDRCKRQGNKNEDARETANAPE